MSREMKELRKLSNEKLLEKHKEMRKALLMTSPKMVKSIYKPQQRGQIRRIIARINTILGERKIRGKTKEEIRLK